jgi:hypothetical protein
MTKRHPNFFEVLVGEIRQDGKADVVFGKPLRVLPEAQLLKPISDLLHPATPQISGLCSPALATLSEKPATQ